MVRCDFCSDEAIVMDKEGLLYCYQCAEREVRRDPFIVEKKEFIHTIVNARRVFEGQIMGYTKPEQKRLKKQFQEKVYEFEMIFDITHYVPFVDEFLVA